VLGGLAFGLSIQCTVFVIPVRYTIVIRFFPLRAASPLAGSAMLRRGNSARRAMVVRKGSLGAPRQVNVFWRGRGGGGPPVLILDATPVEFFRTSEGSCGGGPSDFILYATPAEIF